LDSEEETDLEYSSIFDSTKLTGFNSSSRECDLAVLVENLGPTKFKWRCEHIVTKTLAYGSSASCRTIYDCIHTRNEITLVSLPWF